jgi:hypothetical protein
LVCNCTFSATWAKITNQENLQTNNLFANMAILDTTKSRYLELSALLRRERLRYRRALLVAPVLLVIVAAMVLIYSPSSWATFFYGAVLAIVFVLALSFCVRGFRHASILKTKLELSETAACVEKRRLEATVKFQRRCHEIAIKALSEHRERNWPFVLFLRSFESEVSEYDDGQFVVAFIRSANTESDFETAFARAVADKILVISVAQSQYEFWDRIYFPRLVFDDVDWMAGVETLIKEASIILVYVSQFLRLRTPGLSFELDVIQKHRKVDDTVLVFSNAEDMKTMDDLIRPFKNRVVHGNESLEDLVKSIGFADLLSEVDSKVSATLGERRAYLQRCHTELQTAAREAVIELDVLGSGKWKTHSKYQSVNPADQPLSKLSEAEQEEYGQGHGGHRKRGKPLAASPGRVSTPPGRLWNVPLPCNPFFTGREQILDQLEQALLSEGKVALAQPQAITGLGGIGKTQVALAYACAHRERYQAVLWVTADTKASLVSGFVAIAALLDLPEKDAQEQKRVVAAVLRWLESETDWLLVLDNADDLERVQTFIPEHPKGHLVLITRAQATGGLAQALEVNKMPEEDGALLLLRRAKTLSTQAALDKASTEDREQAKALCRALDGLPLALDQAGAYIEETGCGLAGYLKLYRTRGDQLLAERGQAHPKDHPAAVATTWSLSFEKVEKASAAAAELLPSCCGCVPFCIPMRSRRSFSPKPVMRWDRCWGRWPPIPCNGTRPSAHCATILCWSATQTPGPWTCTAWCRRCSKPRWMRPLKANGPSARCGR